MLIRLPVSSFLPLLPFLLVGACGDDGNSVPVDAPKDIGFTKPTKALKAHNESTFAEIGPADLSCLNTPTSDVATTVDVELTTTVRDFQKQPPNNLVPGATVTLFQEQMISVVKDTATADSNAMLTITVPTGTKRFGFKMTHETSLDTLLLNQKVEPSNPTQMLAQIRMVSKTTAETLPSLINVMRTPGTGVLAGAMRDCQNNTIANFIATVSSTKGSVTHLEGADTYYFSAAAGVPVRHAQAPASAADGRFMIIQLPVTTTAYVQVWGYPTDADLAAGELKLVSELETQVIGDTVITGSYEPLRQ